jgi:xanthine dehydrogenase YagS FAD-binding subunit
MNPFQYDRAQAPEEAIHAIAVSRQTKLLAGGTNLLDLMKDNVEQPSRLVDINRLQLAKIETLPDGGVRIGALARNSDTANNPLIRERYPLLAQALLSGASPQHPSDMCVALAALDAKVQVRGPKGARTIPMLEFHRLPGTTPQLDTNLRVDELITSIDLPPSPFNKNFHYLKVRDRNSYAFALVSVAAALDLSGQTIRDARVALGGVAHKPWRSLEAEQVLNGAAPSEQKFAEAADVILREAHGYKYNAFKVPLAKQAVVRALTVAGGAA